MIMLMSEFGPQHKVEDGHQSRTKQSNDKKFARLCRIDVMIQQRKERYHDNAEETPQPGFANGRLPVIFLPGARKFLGDKWHINPVCGHAGTNSPKSAQR